MDISKNKTTVSSATKPKTSKEIVSDPLLRHRRSGQIEIPLLIVEGSEVQIRVDDVDGDVNKLTTSLEEQVHPSMSAEDMKNSTSSIASDSSIGTDTGSRYRSVNQAIEDLRRDLVSGRQELLYLPFFIISDQARSWQH